MVVFPDTDLKRKLIKLHYFLVILIFAMLITTFIKLTPDNWPALIFLILIIVLYDIGIIYFLHVHQVEDINNHDKPKSKRKEGEKNN